MNRISFVVAILALFTTMGFAELTEDFDDPNLGASYINGSTAILDSGTWYCNAVLGENSDKARGETGRAARINDDTVNAHLATPQLSNGAGVLTFWIREYNSGGGIISIQVSITDQTSGFTEVDSRTFSGETYVEESVVINQPGTCWVRFVNDNNPGHAIIDDVHITDYSTSSDDPNIIVGSNIDFGTIDAGTTKVEELAIRNSGLTNLLQITGISPKSGDTDKFSIGTFPNSIAAGEVYNVQITYQPGSVQKAEHLAVFTVSSNDETVADQNIDVTLTGKTFGDYSVYEVQYTTDAGGNSPLNGETINVSGIVTFLDANGYAISDATSGPYSGIYVYDRFYPAAIGDFVKIRATVDEYYGLTELKDLQSSTIISSNNHVPVVELTSLAEAGSEVYEGCLVNIDDVEVSNPTASLDTNEWEISKNSETLRVDDHNDFTYVPTQGATINSITGCIYYSSSMFKIEPRNDDDIARDYIPYTLKGDVVLDGQILKDYYVTITGNTITRVDSTAPAGKDNLIVETNGYIFPGLIDSHNHPTYNIFKPIEFGKFYQERYDWQADSIYDAWKDFINPIRNSNECNIWKVAEVREMVAGCTTIQNCSYGSSDCFSHPSIGIRNLEKSPARILQKVFPLDMSDDDKTRIRNKRYNRVVIHLCEGINNDAKNEFYEYYNDGLLDDRTVIIHGTALTSTEFDIMAQVGAKLVWSPKSNMVLYNDTTKVDIAKAAGVEISLAPDWTPSGEANILDELYYAYTLNQSMFSNTFTLKELVDMVTLGAAKILGIDDRYGKIEVGYKADIAVFEKLSDDPYMSMIYSSANNVMLTIIGGVPRYGDDAMFTSLGITDRVEDVEVCGGEMKKLQMQVVNPFIDNSDDPFGDYYSYLETEAGVEFLPLGSCSERDDLPVTLTPTPTVEIVDTPTSTPTIEVVDTPTFTLTPTTTPVDTNTPVFTEMPTLTETPVSATETPFEGDSDLNGDGSVDIEDLLIFRNNWHKNKSD